MAGGAFSGRRGRLAAIWAANELSKGRDASLSELAQGFERARAGADTAASVLAPLTARASRAGAMLDGALGLNGAEGRAAAEDAFRASSGYRFALDQSLQALARKHAAAGTLRSGNAEADTIAFAQGLADQGYGDWLGRLAGLDARGLDVARAQAGAAMDLGRLGYQYGADRAGTVRDATKAVTAAGVEGFRAGDQAAANRLGALMGGLNLGARLLGLGTGGRSLGKLFG
jgi:hypothetical protein